MERNLMIAGFGGQGVMLLGKMLAETASENTNKHVTFFPSYGAEMRGGTANCYVVISDDPVGSPLGDVMDDLMVLNAPSLAKFLRKVRPGGTLFVNSSLVSTDIARDDISIVRAPATDVALELGNAKVLNVYMLGVYVGYTAVLEEELILETLRKQLKLKSNLIPVNEEAFRRGLAIGHAQANQNK